MPYNSYDIDFEKFQRSNTPRWAMVQEFYILLYAFIYPLTLIHNAFIRYRDAKLYELATNGQVCYLERFLNDQFDFTQRRIYIEDAELVDNLYIYARAENKPVWFYTRAEELPVYVHTRGESIGDDTWDFVVHVPADISLNEPAMRAMIANNLCGKRYKIERF